MRELINNVIQWANDRNIIEGSTPIKQLDKTSEEFNELQRAVAKQAAYKEAAAPTHVMNDAEDEIRDAFGDVLVTLIIAAKQLDLDLEDCLNAAWFEIKDRKGRLINGLFHKDV